MALTQVIGSGVGQVTDIKIGGSGSANTLDDYEEGSWTATVTGSGGNPSTAATETGSYVKIGRIVYCTVTISSKDTTGASGAVRLTGVPFTPNKSTASGNLMLYYAKSLNSTTANISPYVTASYVAYYQTDYQTSTAWGEISHAAGANFYLYTSFWYETDS